MATGAGVGLAIGCVSIFPNFIAGCILGTGIGAGIGAYNGITGANPNVQPAFYEWLTHTVTSGRVPGERFTTTRRGPPR